MLNGMRELNQENVIFGIKITLLLMRRAEREKSQKENKEIDCLLKLRKYYSLQL